MFAIKFHLAVREGEKRMIATNPDIGPGMKTSSALPNDDISGNHLLASILFHSKTLGMTVAAVSRCTLSFFMCHGSGRLKNYALIDSI